jgi:hypothetical protein
MKTCKRISWALQAIANGFSLRKYVNKMWHSHDESYAIVTKNVVTCQCEMLWAGVEDSCPRRPKNSWDKPVHEVGFIRKERLQLEQCNHGFTHTGPLPLAGLFAPYWGRVEQPWEHSVYQPRVRFMRPCISSLVQECRFMRPCVSSGCRAHSAVREDVILTHLSFRLPKPTVCYVCCISMHLKSRMWKARLPPCTPPTEPLSVICVTELSGAGQCTI